MTAQIGGASYWVGSHRYLEDRAQETEEIHNLLVNKAHEGRTVVIVESDHQVMGLWLWRIAYAPTPPERSRTFVRAAWNTS